MPAARSSSASGAAAATRSTLSHPAVARSVLHYTSLKQITDDIDDARVYGGIHFRFDQEAGAKQGRHVGQYVFAHYLGDAPQ